MSRSQLTDWRRYSIAVVSVGAATLLYFAAVPWPIESEIAYFGLSIAVLLTSAIAGLLPGLLATVLAAFVSVFVFVPPAAFAHAGLSERFARVIIFGSQTVLLAFVGDLMHRARTEGAFVSWGERYLRPVLLVSTATAVKLVAWRNVECEMPFMFYYVTTAASAWLGGFGPGLLATFLAALCARFFFLEPRYSVAVSSSMDVLRVGLFMVEGAGIAFLAGKQNAAREAANRAIQRMRQYGDLLLQSTVRARALRTLSKDVVWEWDLPSSITIPDDAKVEVDTSAASSFSSWLSGIHPGDRLRILASLKAAMQEGVAEWYGEYRRLFPGKGYLHVSDHAFILRDAARHPVRVVGRSETEESRRPPAGFEEDSAYRALFENNPYAMLLADRRLQILDANNAACDVLGYSHDALTRRGLDDVLPAAASVVILSLSPADAPSITFQEDCTRATGEVFRARITAAMIRGIEKTSADRIITIEETAEADVK
jgi:PAS domain S-box-containing protein